MKEEKNNMEDGIYFVTEEVDAEIASGAASRIMDAVLYGGNRSTVEYRNVAGER